MVGDGLTVLVTDGDRACRDRCQRLLTDDHEVLVARDGEAAVAALSASVDVVLIGPNRGDRGAAGAIADSPHDPAVILVGPATPDTGSDEVPVHDTLTEPVDRSTLEGAIERCRDRLAYERALTDYFSLTARLGELEADRSREALAEDERYRRLQWLAQEQRVQVDMALTDGPADWTRAVRSLDADATAGTPRRGV